MTTTPASASSSPTLRILWSASTDPWFNLAVEEVIFRQMPPTQRVLFLWRNADTVVIGRAQNPWKECHTARMAEEGVKLARRSSGGGAVFQDLGNTCFTFMAGKPGYDKHAAPTIVLRALQQLGIAAYAAGRNDLLVDTAHGARKISGSASRETADRGFQHGTLLLNTDLDRLQRYLNPDPKKLQAKGIRSVRARVANLAELMPTLTHQQVCEAIQQAFFDYYQQTAPVEHISPQPLPDLPGLEAQFRKQQSWLWNFGHAPQFSHTLDTRFAWGGVELCFDVENGHIVRARIFTDSLHPAPLEQLAETLTDVPYQPQAVLAAVKQVQARWPEHRAELAETGDWLARQLR